MLIDHDILRKHPRSLIVDVPFRSPSLIFIASIVQVAISPMGGLMISIPP